MGYREIVASKLFVVTGSSGGSRKFCRGGPNIFWPLAVAGRLVIEDISGSRVAQ